MTTPSPAPTPAPNTADPLAQARALARRGARLALVGVLASSVLAAVKIVAGVLGNAYALIADGVESLVDILGSLVVWGSLKIAVRPPDDDHPWGHGKAESLGAIVIAVALLAAGAGIAVQSVREILTPHHAPAPWTLIVLVGVVAAKEILFRTFVHTGRRIGSRAVEADAWHHRSDALTSAAAFIGISISWIAGPGYESADDWAALFACVVIAFNGARLLKVALGEVMDAAPSPEIETEVRRIAESVAGVRGTHKCRIRKSGLVLLVDLQIVVDGEWTVRRGHDIAHRVKDALLESALNVIDVSVHVEPDGGAADRRGTSDGTGERGSSGT